MNKLLFVALAASAIPLSTVATRAQVDDICTTHTVSKGETLRSIAKSNYGSEDDYHYIYTANQTALGLSPHIIPVGMSLNIPCVGESPADVTEVAETSVVVETPIIAEPEPEKPETVAEVQPVTEPIVEPTPEPQAVVEQVVDKAVEEEVTEIESKGLDRIITVGFAGNSPYSDSNIYLGGLTSAIVQSALTHGGASGVFPPTFVASSSAGMATSTLPDKFHLSFPWLKPDCTLSEYDANIRNLCDNFTFSAPIHEAQMAMFVFHDGPLHNAASVNDLVGTRICRPASMHTYDLVADGIVEPIVTLETASNIEECFAKLITGAVDVVSVNGLAADLYFVDSGNAGQFQELPELAAMRTIHAISPKNDREATIAMSYLNSGLWEMLASGEWGEIAMNYLTDHLQ